MSMNLNIQAVRKVMVIKTGKVRNQSLDFDCVQTPTRVSYEIMEMADKIAGYKAYVMSISQDEEEELYADDDYMCEEPIGTRTVNRGADHCRDLDMFLSTCADEGYDIEVYVM
jgi:hypothetical protein